MQNHTFIFMTIFSLMCTSITKAQLEYSEIKNFYNYANQNNLIHYTAPMFHQDDKKRTMAFSPGSAIISNRSNNILLDQAFECQGMIESIRTTRTTRSQKEFWRRPLEAAEDRIASSLNLQNGENQQDAARKLKLDVKEILIDAIRDYARSKGYRYGPSAPAPKAYNVSFSLASSEASVAYMPAGDFILHHYFKDSDEVSFPLPDWTGVDSPREGVSLYGRFYFKYTDGETAYVTPHPYLLTRNAVFNCTTSGINPR
ncbi:hypothetical protein [Gimesia maris]|uniref:hypothetical protein n=1 Tax=Gimesia maris TaxID=122 RepID=UPI003A94D5A8